MILIKRKFLCGFLLSILLLSSKYSIAQYDSLYAIKYPERLGLSIFESVPSYQIKIRQYIYHETPVLSTLNYSTLAHNVVGFEFDFDKISFFAGWKAPGDLDLQEKKGKSNFSQFQLNVTGVKLRIEGAYRNYSGFYDSNSPGYLPNFTDTTAYYFDGNMKNRLLKLKALYFLNKNKRFSYGAAYLNNVRQLKSAGSFIIAGNLYSYKVTSDQPLIPSYISNFYGDWSQMSRFKAAGVSAGLGYTYTITFFKRIYFNFLLSFGIEEQHLIMNSTDHETIYDSWKTKVSAYDVRAALGYNSQRFFISLQTIVDGNNYYLPGFIIGNQYVCPLFNIGYRFHVKTPGFYKKIQQTKVYKVL